MTELVHTPEDLRAACAAARAQGHAVGLVPTMGALHRGHLSLVGEAKRRTSFVVATVFVNPLQFGPSEDLARYPRTLSDDHAALESLGVDVVFAPDAQAMYPAGFQTRVEVGELTRPLEGAFRPGHFHGVTTVVAKLFLLAGPCVAVFGRKDYQQWRVIAQMAHDLAMPVEVVGMPTVREPDGLALSSRNRYLDAEARRRALGIAEGLRSAYDAHARGERHPDALRRLCHAPIEARFDSIDYVEAVHPGTLGPLEGPSDELVLLVAAHLGGTRLIDNCVLGVDPRP